MYGPLTCVFGGLCPCDAHCVPMAVVQGVGALSRCGGMGKRGRAIQPAGSMRQRSPGSWELRAYAGVDALTGKVRYQTRTVRASKAVGFEGVTRVGCLGAGRSGVWCPGFCFDVA